MLDSVRGASAFKMGVNASKTAVFANEEGASVSTVLVTSCCSPSDVLVWALNVEVGPFPLVRLVIVPWTIVVIVVIVVVVLKPSSGSSSTR